MIKKYTLILFSLFFSVPVFATAPLITDDTGTQGKGKFQVELDYAVEATKSNSGQELYTTFSWGVADNVDVIVGIPYNWHPFTEEGRPIAIQKGIGDTAVEIKWRFFESSPQNGLSFALKSGVSLPTGDAEKGLGNGDVSKEVMMIATKEWQHGAFHCDVGYVHNTYSLEEENEVLRHHLWHASVAAEVRMMKNLRSVVDIGIDTSTVTTSETHPVYVIGGLVYSVTDSFDVDFGVKGGLNNTAPVTTVLVGVTSKF